MTDNKNSNLPYDKQYTSVKVPKALSEIIKNSTTYTAWGYRSVSEFILDSARRRIDKGDEVRT